MLTPKTCISAALTALATTLLLATGTCLYLMATSEGEVTRRTGLFGSVVFESVKKPDGAIDVSTGVQNTVPLVIIFAVLTFFFSCFVAIYRALKERKRALEDDGASAR